MTHREKDELVLAAIIAGAKGSGVKVRRGSWGYARYTGVPGVDPVRPTGPHCAIGCGLLYTGIISEWCADLQFAKAHRVSALYARGVSCGFEETDADREHSDIFHHTPMFYRGYAVGRAAQIILNPRNIFG